MPLSVTDHSSPWDPTVALITASSLYASTSPSLKSLNEDGGKSLEPSGGDSIRIPGQAKKRWTWRSSAQTSHCSTGSHKTSATWVAVSSDAGRDDDARLRAETAGKTTFVALAASDVVHALCVKPNWSL